MAKTVKVNRTCDKCGKSFKGVYSSIPVAKFFCSGKCYDLWKEKSKTLRELAEELTPYHFKGCDCPSDMIGQFCGLKRKEIINTFLSSLAEIMRDVIGKPDKCICDKVKIQPCIPCIRNVLKANQRSKIDEVCK